MSHLVKTSSPSVLPVNESNKTTGRPLPLKMKIGVTLYQIINVVSLKKKEIMHVV